MKMSYVLLALAAGLFIPIQAGINAKLGRLLGHAQSAALISFAVGTLILGALLLSMRTPLPLSQTWSTAPWWYWLGGLLGAFFVTCTIYLAPRLGAGTMVALILTSQILTSLVLDHFGLLGYPLRPIDFQRLFGAALLIAGLFLIKG